ncbi:hypothetical protein JCGZ_18778 [Jatropha curcas]|uniref:Uncharacterized protein n=1 Tax=Jatropha curcas TaxID=180498 RepID=A0A067LAP3_JATCU|nr:hypothetical protein JCGZ_18778 [Jatropha curcas]
MLIVLIGGLSSINLKQLIACGYPTCSPSGPIRPKPSLAGMAPKKAKRSKLLKLSKVAEAMRKKLDVCNLEKGGHSLPNQG